MSRTTLVAAAILGVAAWAALSGSYPRLPSSHRPRPEPRSAPVTAHAAVVHDTLGRGETLGQVFARHGLADLDLAALQGLLDPRRLRAGLALRFEHAHPDSAPSAVVVRASAERRVRYARATAGWTATSEPVAWTPATLVVAGAIRSSLYDAIDDAPGAAALGAGERAQLAWAVADAFAWQVDFTRDLQPGDRLRVLVQRETSDEGETRIGGLLAGELTAGGRALSAFRFDGADGRTGWYDAEGQSLRRAFLVAPLEFRRISSTFARARRHPVLGIVRRHEGTDYAAAPGTPVMATGDGVVLRAGYAGGYGNLVELRHANGITTRYGHLSRLAAGLRAGARVGQGEVIGYVGSTGLASGPHLHYEFRVGGVAQDPRHRPVEAGRTLGGAELEAFRAARDALLALLARTDAAALAT